MKDVICLMGPTASGKTSLALELAKKFPIEIISVDSALVYRELNIGAAKPSAETLASVPHHLINIRSLDEVYTAGDFYQDALTLIGDILSRDKLPLLVGGTMMYFNLLQSGVANLPPADRAIRQQLEQQAAEKSWPEMHAKLAAVDPLSASRINVNDQQRIQRALEVYELTGCSITQLQRDNRSANYRFINIALTPVARILLHQLIEKRFIDMLSAGFIEEVDGLFKIYGAKNNLPGLRTVGYRQIIAYLNGEYDYETMCAKALAATRQLAKRQLTWLRRWQHVNWFDSHTQNLTEQVAMFVKDKLNLDADK